MAPKQLLDMAGAHLGSYWAFWHGLSASICPVLPKAWCLHCAKQEEAVLLLTGS
jgi:hypothetical protein